MGVTFPSSPCALGSFWTEPGPQNMCPMPVCQPGNDIEWPFLDACTLTLHALLEVFVSDDGLGVTEFRVLTSEVLGFILPESRIVGLGVLRSGVLWEEVLVSGVLESNMLWLKC